LTIGADSEPEVARIAPIGLRWTTSLALAEPWSHGGSEDARHATDVHRAAPDDMYPNHRGRFLTGTGRDLARVPIGRAMLGHRILDDVRGRATA
jgi:hypothetical protein